MLRYPSCLLVKKHKICTNKYSSKTNNQIHSYLLRRFLSMEQHDAREAFMNNNAALTLTFMHTYFPTTKPSPILLGLVDSLQILYRITCCCLFSSCSSFGTVKKIFQREGNCLGHRCCNHHIYTNIDHGSTCIEAP